MAINDWPMAERPREKLLEKGAKFLSDAELLAIFLRTGTKGKTAVDMARELIQQFGGLRPLLKARQEQFCAMHGLGPAKYAQLQAVLEMSRRHLLEQLIAGDCISQPSDTQQFLIAHLRDYPHEVFACLFLDSKNQVINFSELSHGTINGAAVYPREVVKKALHHNAAAVIFAHNHPSGITEPSEADISLTQRLVKALALIDIRVLDHFIVGNGKTTSLAERGLL